MTLDHRINYAARTQSSTVQSNQSITNVSRHHRTNTKSNFTPTSNTVSNMHLIRSVVNHGKEVDNDTNNPLLEQEDSASQEESNIKEDENGDVDTDTDIDEQEAQQIEESEEDLDATPESEIESESEPAANDTDNDNDIDNDNDAAPPQDSPSESAISSSSSQQTEAQAISIATKAADENYQPSQSLLSSSSPYPLIRSVDGISLKTYNSEPSRFSAKDVMVPLRGNLNVPIHVTASGSVVDYVVECKDFDIGFGVIAEREEGVTVVKEKTRQDCHLNAITGRFLVGSVPCALIFSFDNEFSWFREKKVTYKIKVSPPTIENIIQGRRTRAKSALSVVQSDKESAETRLESVSDKHGTLMQEIERLETELAEKRKSLGVVEKEEGWLKQRVQLRDVQESLLTRRIVEGWEDEAAALAEDGNDGDGGGGGGEEEEVQRAEI